MDIKRIALGTGCLMAISLANAAPTYVAGTSLQDELNSRTLDGTLDQDVKTDQYQPDEVWTLDAAAAGNTTMLFELAGNAGVNTMGIYDLQNTSNSLTLFEGGAAAGYSSRLSINSSGVFISTLFDADGTFISQDSATLSSFNFGFYLGTPDGTFYSQAAQNGDLDADGVDDDHMIAIRGTDSDQIDATGSGFYGDFTPNNFILAWEDLAFDNQDVDYDYNDMAVIIESFVPVPEPGTLALLGLGLMGLGAARRRSA